MITRPHSRVEDSFCPQVQQWSAQYDQRAELLIVYGGMRADEVLYLTETASEESRIFWLERTEPTVTPALAAMVEGGRLVVSGVTRELPFTFFDYFDPKEDLAFELLSGDRSVPEDQLVCEEALKALRERISLEVFNTGTMVSKGLLWQNNTLQNLPQILRSPGVGALYAQFVGKPAVVAGAGPSLSAIIPLLKELKDQFLLISTGTALAPLRAAGIRPDLVIAVDGSPLIGRQFMLPAEDLYFIGSTIVFPGITQRFKGSFYSFLDANPIDQWVKEHSAASGRLYAGGTVTACGMDVAVEMGCDPVITIGLDLAYGPDGASHASGTMYHGIRAERKQLIPVPGNWEEEVYTTKQFECYIKLIEQYIDYQETCRFINLTDGGARILGMDTRPTAALRELGQGAFDAYGWVATIHQAQSPKDTDDALSRLRKIGGYLAKVQTLCRNGAMDSNRLVMMMRHPQYMDPEEMQVCLARIQEIDDALEQGGEYDFLKMSLWGAAYELALKPQENEQQLGERELVLNRAKRFYEQVAGAAKWSRELIGRACRNLEQTAA